MDVSRIRIRRVGQRLLIGRRYEVEIPADERKPAKHATTRAPVALLVPILGVGDAWALIAAADRAWDGRVGQWVTLFGHD